MFSLKHYRSFSDYDFKRSKKYILEAKQFKEKIRSSKRRKEQPKMSHVYLMMLFETLSLDTAQEFNYELEAMFAMTYIWHETIASELKRDPESKMRE